MSLGCMSNIFPSGPLRIECRYYDVQSIWSLCHRTLECSGDIAHDELSSYAFHWLCNALVSVLSTPIHTYCLLSKKIKKQLSIWQDLYACCLGSAFVWTCVLYYALPHFTKAFCHFGMCGPFCFWAWGLTSWSLLSCRYSLLIGSYLTLCDLMVEARQITLAVGIKILGNPPPPPWPLLFFFYPGSV